MTAAAVNDTAGYADRRERTGWYFYEWANHGFYTVCVTVFLGPYLSSVTQKAADAHGMVHPLGIPVAAGSFFSYVVSLSVLLSVFVLPVIGAIADRSARKRELMAVCAYLGAAATVLLLFCTDDRYLLGGVLFLVANICYSASIVVYYSFLPQLAPPDKRDSVSSIGWSFGYVGGGVLLAFAVVAVLAGPSLGWVTGTIARCALAAAGIWWAGFTIIPLVTLRNRPPLEGVAQGNPLVFGFRQLGRTLSELRAFPLTILFLVGFLIYNDGIQTVILLAAQYATDELKLAQAVLVPTILLIQFVAFFGALAMGAVAKRIGAVKTVLGSLVAWIVLIVCAFFLPAGQILPFMALGVGIGLVLGGSQALSRSLFSQLIPPGKEAEYFGIYVISDKGTSWLGPLLFGLVFQFFGSYRLAIISLIIFFVVGAAVLAFVPIRKAIEQAGNTPPALL
jgi:UMF1 family MFS transporter